MPLLTKILFPVDFSEHCRGAAVYVNRLASLFSAELIFLHVLPAEDSVAFPDEGAARLGKLRQFFADQPGRLRILRVLRVGDPAAEIVRLAHEEGVNLIMMPTRGLGPFRRMMLGSVTAKVLHDADCPVWTGVHMEDAAPPRPEGLRRIVCAVDLGPQSEAVLEWTKRLAADSNAATTVVHATPAMEAGPEKYLDQEFAAHLAKAARATLEPLMAKVGIDAEVRVIGGDVTRVVTCAAKEANADLLIIGRNAGAGLFGRLRPHAYALIRQSPCPVISV
jgi:nucleotide-binding universal stress UspA family protein